MSTLRNIALVAAGGALGCVLRYALTLGAVALGAPTTIGTLTANGVGCFAGGVLVGAVPPLRTADDPWRLLLVTGLLGGLTTFSALSMETVHLFQGGKPGLGAANMGGNVALGIAAVWAGYAVSRMLGQYG